MSLGSELREVREVLGMTQASAAEYIRKALDLADFSPSTVSAYEIDRTPPSQEALAALAAYYRVGDEKAADWEMKRRESSKAKRLENLNKKVAQLSGAPGGRTQAAPATFRPDAPAAEGVSVPRVSDAQDRDDRVASGDELRAMVKEILTRQRTLETRVTKLEGRRGGTDRTLGKLRPAISSRSRMVARARVQPTITRPLAVVPLAWGTDAPRGTVQWMH